jgi:hypothetical protein
MENLSKRLKELEGLGPQRAQVLGRPVRAAVEQTVVASLVGEMEVLMLFLAAQHLLLRDLRALEPSPRGKPQPV